MLLKLKTTLKILYHSKLVREIRKYIAVDVNDYYSPLKDSQTRVSNQNLKGTIFTNAQGVKQDVDYIIITPSLLGTQAEKLANFHRNYSKLNVKVVFLEKFTKSFPQATRYRGNM